MFQFRRDPIRKPDRRPRPKSCMSMFFQIVLVPYIFLSTYLRPLRRRNATEVESQRKRATGKQNKRGEINTKTERKEEKRKEKSKVKHGSAHSITET